MASSELARYYAELLAEQEESGLSVSVFAEEAGVSAATLYSWRRRLGCRKEKPALVEVDVVRRTASASSPAGVTLHLDDRFRIELPSDFDEDTLLRLLRLLDRC